jgi:NADH-quinone oxidoreductase subunit N
MYNQLMHLIPELIIISTATLLLISTIVIKDNDVCYAYSISQIGIIIALFFVIKNWNMDYKIVFNLQFIDDNLARVLKLFSLLFMLVVFLYTEKYLKMHKSYNNEYFALCLFSLIGMMVLISSSNFLILYLGLELLSLPLYALITIIRKHNNATEAAIKFFVMGALSSGMLLYGISLLYGLSGSLNLNEIGNCISINLINDSMILKISIVFIIVGIAFKLGAVPFHMWVPDVYEGTPNTITLFIGSIPKIAAFAMSYRVLSSLIIVVKDWSSILTILIILSLLIGNIVAIAQSNIKRMLAYSTISHISFLLMGFISFGHEGFIASLFYVIVYTLTSICAFGVIISLSSSNFEMEKLEDFKGLGKKHPLLALIMMITMFSMAGIPPTIGFYAKFIVIKSVVASGLYWLAIISVVFSVIGSFYYLRIIKLMYFENCDNNTKNEGLSRAGYNILFFNGILLLILGIYPIPILNLCLNIF